MSGSGVRIGMMRRIMEAVLGRILLVFHRVRIASFAGAPGATTPGASGPQTATGTIRPSGTAAWVFGLSCLQASESGQGQAGAGAEQ
ncbi:MAG: hypothetical protein A2511_03930 [Deltaproteobacteria bacterium RIFOXYD12_FULL_50_9]|nr:MAG: hypothetical protein A2511_03930 [Deltaproteobacteria bacterium RIFOXYD12_FULL_50_9]